MSRVALMDSLVEAITELVMKELESSRRSGVEMTSTASAPTLESAPAKAAGKGPKVLVVRGPEAVDEGLWATLSGAPVRPSLLSWEDAPSSGSGLAASWPTETRVRGWSKAVADYGAVILLGSDLPLLGSIAQLGAGGQPPSAITVAAVAAGLPVFCENAAYEKIRRHSARLAPGFTRALEEHLRTVAGFGIELGTSAELGAFLARLGPTGSAPAAAQSKGGGRDVVTTEDVEAVRRAGLTQLHVGMGAIVTPLARQQALDWGIEVKFQ